MLVQYVSDGKNQQVLQPVTQTVKMQPAQLNQQQVQHQVHQQIIQQQMTMQQQQQLAQTGLTFQQPQQLIQPKPASPPLLSLYY